MARRSLRRSALLIILMTSLTALAQQPGGARALFEQGIALSDEGKWAEALECFRKSDRLVPSPTVRYNIAVSLRALGRYVEARGTLREILDPSPAPKQPLKASLRADCEKLLAQVRDKVVDIRIRVRPKGAQLQIDGTAALVDEDGHLELDPGQHVFTLTARGYQTTTVTRELTPADTELVLSAPKLDGSEGSGAKQPSSPIYESGWFWAVAGVVVVGATTAIVLTRHADQPGATLSAPPSTVDRVLPAWVRF